MPRTNAGNAASAGPPRARASEIPVSSSAARFTNVTCPPRSSVTSPAVIDWTTVSCKAESAAESPSLRSSSSPAAWSCSPVAPSCPAR